jgi:hypothetical protein
METDFPVARGGFESSGDSAIISTRECIPRTQGDNTHTGNVLHANTLASCRLRTHRKSIQKKFEYRFPQYWLPQGVMGEYA